MEPPVTMVVRTCNPAGNNRNTCHTGITCIAVGFDRRACIAYDASTCFAGYGQADLHPSDGGTS